MKGEVSEVVTGADEHVREVCVQTNSEALGTDIRSLCVLESSEQSRYTQSNN